MATAVDLAAATSAPNTLAASIIWLAWESFGFGRGVDLQRVCDVANVSRNTLVKCLKCLRGKLSPSLPQTPAPKSNLSTYTRGANVVARASARRIGTCAGGPGGDRPGTKELVVLAIILAACSGAYWLLRVRHPRWRWINHRMDMDAYLAGQGHRQMFQLLGSLDGPEFKSFEGLASALNDSASWTVRRHVDTLHKLSKFLMLFANYFLLRSEEYRDLESATDIAGKLANCLLPEQQAGSGCHDGGSAQGYSGAQDGAKPQAACDMG